MVNDWTDGELPELTDTPQRVIARAIYYEFHDYAGLEFVQGKKRAPVASFEPRLTKRIDVVQENGETECFYELTVTQPNYGSIVLSVSGEELENTRALQKRLAAVLPVEFVVYPSGWQHIGAAARVLSMGLQNIEVQYASMGWSDQVYLLPSMSGAVFAEGFSAYHKIHDRVTQKLPKRLLSYGAGVRPPLDEAERIVAGRAFSLLLATSPVAAAVAVQVLAAPLVGLAGRISPPLLHVRGRTGSMKTTLCTLCLNLAGRFERDEAPETWLSTQNALSRRLYEAKDITLLIDDYKKGRGEPMALIQAYADGTARSRMGQDQENRQTLLPRGLMLSTGEDAWEEHESVEARTITVPLEFSQTASLQERVAPFREAQDAARRGELGLFGGAWVQWLAQRDRSKIPSGYRGFQRKHLDTLVEEYGQIHPRLLETLASFLAAGDFVDGFIVRRFPELREKFITSWAVARSIILKSAEERAEESASTAPFDVLITELRQAYESGTVRFTHRNSTAAAALMRPNGVRPEPVGFYDETYIYVTKGLTYQWAEQRARSAGRSLTYSWSAFCQGAREALGLYIVDGKDRRVSYLLWAVDRPVRAVVLPRELIVGTDSEVTGLVFTEDAEFDVD